MWNAVICIDRSSPRNSSVGRPTDPGGRCPDRNWHPHHDVFAHGHGPALRLDIPQSDLDDLDDRLDRTRRPDDLSGTGWAYGVPANYLRELVRYWRHSYDRRAAEAQLNEWPQFTTTIDGANIHFAHIRGGHFAAMEEPELLVGDVRAFFRQLREKAVG